MKKLALVLAMTGAAAFSTNAIAMGGGCNYDSGYKHTAVDTQDKDAAVFADNNTTETSQTATQKK